MAKEVLGKVPQENWDDIFSRLPLASAFRAASELQRPERQAYAYHGKPSGKRARYLVLISRNAKMGKFLNDQFLESCIRPYSEDENGIMTFDNGVQLWRGPLWMHDFVIENLVSHLLAPSTSKLYFVKWDDEGDGISEVTLKGGYNQMDTNCSYFGFLKTPLLPHWGFLVRQSTLYSERRELPGHADKEFPGCTGIPGFDCYDEREPEFKAIWSIALDTKMVTDPSFIDRWGGWGAAIARLESSKPFRLENN